MRKRRLSSVEDALKEVLRRLNVKGIKLKGKEENFLDFVCRAAEIERDELLHELADVIGLEFVTELQVPKHAEIAKLRLDTKECLLSSILPQTRHGLPILVVADPFLIEREAFEEQGIRVVLGDERRIEEVWTGFFSGEIQVAAKEEEEKEQVTSVEEADFMLLAHEYRKYTANLPKHFPSGRRIEKRRPSVLVLSENSFLREIAESVFLEQGLVVSSATILSQARCVLKQYDSIEYFFSEIPKCSSDRESLLRFLFENPDLNTFLFSEQKSSIEDIPFINAGVRAIVRGSRISDKLRGYVKQCRRRNGEKEVPAASCAAKVDDLSELLGFGSPT
ncbi:MAG: hypothetical protein KDD60_00065 [Bdellovibrionales bacterium]|nr:hypothetical protein [Bdellovibrionales bacterium]